MKRHAKALVAVLIAMLCLGATAALALQTHTPGAPFDGTGSPDEVPNGAFGPLSGIAVDQSGSDIYVLDATGAADSSGALQRFQSDTTWNDRIDGTATPSGSLALGNPEFEPSDVAVDSSGTGSDGNFYITDSGHGVLDAFDSTGSPLASFGDSEPKDGQLHGAKTGPGSFGFVCGVAVDQTNGNILIADRNNNRVWVYGSAGNFLGPIADASLNGPCGLATTSTGDLYVANANDGKVLRFNKAAGSEYNFGGVFYAPDNGTPENGEDDGPGAVDVAVNTAGDNVFIDRGVDIAEYEQFGGRVSTFGALSGSRAIAVDSSSGKVYATQGQEVKTFGALTTVPDATTGPASNVTDTEATLEGKVDPAGGPDAQCEFEYDTDGSYASPTKTPCAPAGPFSSPEAVHADITGLSAATTYHYRLHATSANGPNDGADKTFATDGPPLVDSLRALKVGAFSAELVASINPSGAATAYHFEYTTEADFEANGFANAVAAPVPDEQIGSANTAQTVSKAISGLDPVTRYAYRVVATNPQGSAEAGPGTFRTYLASKVADGAFPGQGFLPDDRAWEMVSPPDKNGGQVAKISSLTQAALDGNAVAFGSRNGFGDIAGYGLFAQYLGERTAAPGTNGWSTHGITPPLQPQSASFTQVVVPEYRLFSPDLTRGVFQLPESLPGGPTPLINPNANLYLRTDLRQPGTGTYQLLSDAQRQAPLPLQLSSQVGTGAVSASADLGTVAFFSRMNLTEETTGVQTKSYASTGGAPTLVARIPPPGQASCDDSTSSPCEPVGGSVIGMGEPNVLGGSDIRNLHAVSADGSRIFFGYKDSAYMREDGHRTVKLNASEKDSPEAPAIAKFWDASTGVDAAGEPAPIRAFFTTNEQLIETDQDSSIDLYMWSQQPDGEGHHLSIVSPQPGLGGDSVVGVSDDGTQVYFLSNFSLLHSDEGTISEVGAFVDFADVAPNLLESRFGLDTFFLAPARVSPDGRHLLFMVSTASGFVGHGGLIDYDPGTCSPDGIPKPCRELYVYSAEDETLRCASCNPSGEAATATAMVGVKEGIAVLAPHASRAISDDGRYVFFSTAERLVAEDVNGVEDAYEYDTLSEEPHLLSSGEDPRPSYFMDASPDGRDVFFLTSEQLSAWDSDDSVDLYDARRGGGIAEPVPPPPACQGDACQPPPVILNDLSPGSQTFAGAGNQSARRCRARTGRVAKQAGKKQRRGTKRCRRVKRGAVR